MEDINDIILEPDPARIMEGLRDTGYDFNMAMADLVDNSIAANANIIKVNINSLPDDTIKLYIADNGCGMTMEGLKNAMRYGSKRRANASSLGKFGLGLKTASTAFCRSLSLLSRGSDNGVHKVQWDLDEICKINKWKLLQPTISEDEMELLDEVAEQSTGILVIWEKIDRLVKDYQRASNKNKALQKILESLEFHFSMVYQRFLDKTYTEHPIKLYLNNKSIKPWDPFCLAEEQTTHTATKKVKAELPNEEYSYFTLNAYVLPRKENFSSQNIYSEARINNDMQGFYIYRENRLIHYGDWGSIRRKDPHFSLARVELSFDHSLDEAFNVDIKKSRIHINEYIADYLEKEFLPSTIRLAEERYRKIKQDSVIKGCSNVHDASGINIAEKAKSLEESQTNILDKTKNKVKVTNREGEFTTTIKIIPLEGKRQCRVVPVDTLDGNVLWEPTLIDDGQHAVSINQKHDFYTKVYGPNIENADLIQGLDYLFWGLSEAEMSTYNDETKEQYEEMRNHVSRILKKLVKDLDDPETID